MNTSIYETVREITGLLPERFIQETKPGCYCAQLYKYGLRINWSDAKPLISLYIFPGERGLYYGESSNSETILRPADVETLQRVTLVNILRDLRQEVSLTISDGDKEWRTTLESFLAHNSGEEDAEIRRQACALKPGETIWLGGGAGALFSVTRSLGGKPLTLREALAAADITLATSVRATGGFHRGDYTR